MNFLAKKFERVDRKEDPPRKIRASQSRNNFQKFFL